jgi:hypothetical protein
MRPLALALFPEYRDLQELMAERILTVDRTIMWRDLVSVR